MSKNNVLALAYCKELNWILAAGVEGEIKVISLARPQNREGMDPLPTVLYGHTQKITALVVLKNYVAASAGHDRQIRFWDLHTMVRFFSYLWFMDDLSPTSASLLNPWRPLSS